MQGNEALGKGGIIGHGMGSGFGLGDEFGGKQAEDKNGGNDGG